MLRMLPSGSIILLTGSWDNRICSIKLFFTLVMSKNNYLLMLAVCCTYINGKKPAPLSRGVLVYAGFFSLGMGGIPYVIMSGSILGWNKLSQSTENLPQLLSMNGVSYGTSAQNNDANMDHAMVFVEQLILQLCNPDLRENALLELSKKRELFQDLATLLWNSFGTMAALLQEIISIYPALSWEAVTPEQSNRACNALALLQCVASHPDTRMPFLRAHMPTFLYPILNTTCKSRSFEFLRLTSLGVIGALVKVDDTEVITFLLSTEVIPLCLRTMEIGCELSKTVATYIVQKVLLKDDGLDYICATAERFLALGRVLGNMVEALAEKPSSRLMKHIIRCYLLLSENRRAGDALKSCLPDVLRDATFSSGIEDPRTREWLEKLLENVGEKPEPSQDAGDGEEMELDDMMDDG